jgi:hypothetical protein
MCVDGEKLEVQIERRSGRAHKADMVIRQRPCSVLGASEQWGTYIVSIFLFIFQDEEIALFIRVIVA